MSFASGAGLGVTRSRNRGADCLAVLIPHLIRFECRAVHEKGGGGLCMNMGVAGARRTKCLTMVRSVASATRSTVSPS